MTPASPRTTAPGLGLRCTVAAALVALAAGCSSDSTSTARTESTTAATTSSIADRGSGTGTIAGEPFAVGTQLVQWESLSNAWRLHLLSGDHSCADDLGGVRPSVGIDFQGPTESTVTVPEVGTSTEGVGVVFRPTDRQTGFGPLTTTTGVTLTLELTTSLPGAHWKGHLTVASFEQDGATYGFDGPIDAEVCEPVTG